MRSLTVVGLSVAAFSSLLATETRAVSIVEWRSIRVHSGVGDLAIVLNPTATGNGLSGPTVETRGEAEDPTGIRRIQVKFDGNVTVNNPLGVVVTGRTTVAGVLGPPLAYVPASVVATAADTIDINFNAGQLPTDTCYVITISQSAILEPLTGDNDVRVRSLLGDVTGDGSVNLGDALAAKNRAASTQPVNTSPQFDVNLSGSINLGDALLIRSRTTSPPHQALCGA